MRILPYLAILIVGVGTLLLGVELMTLPQKSAMQLVNEPNKLTNAPNKLAQHEADQRAEKTEGDTSRPLTPLYPANPGGAKDVRVVYPQKDQSRDQTTHQNAATIETTGSASVDEKKPDVTAAADAPAAAPQQPQAAEPQQENTGVPLPPQKLHTAKAEERSTPKPVQPAGEHSANQNHCDVQACANAYASFRASDCTYQPFEGARHVCSAPPAQHSVEREVSAHDVLPSSRAPQFRPQVGPRDDPAGYADEEDDGADAPIGNGQRVIILDRGYRPWR